MKSDRALAPIALLALFVSFWANAFGIADHHWFQSFQRDSESLIVGRMAESRFHGILSHAGMQGRGSIIDSPSDAFGFQYDAYMGAVEFRQFEVYPSQVGIQGMIFSVLDRLLPFSAGIRLILLRAFASLGLAAVLTGVVMWLQAELGRWTAILAFFGILCSSWLTVAGRNLWWSLALFFLPMLAVMVFTRSRHARGPRRNIVLFSVVFGSMLLKVLNGYEYVTAVALMTIVPILYLHLADGSPYRRLFRDVTIATTGMILATLLSLGVLSVQLAIIKGSWTASFEQIVSTLRKRTYANPMEFPPQYRASLRASPTEILPVYLKGEYLRTSRWSVSYQGLFGFFVCGSLALVLLERRQGSIGSRQKSYALITATWLSVSAPLSWFVLFKSHSYIHVHMNFLLWQMPFTILGFAVLGRLATVALRHVGRERPPLA